MTFNVHCFHVYPVSKCGNKPGMQLGNLIAIIKSNVLSSQEMYIKFLLQNLPALKYVKSTELSLHQMILRSTGNLRTRTGIVPYSKTCEVFENTIKSKKIDPQLIVHVLIHMEFCQEIKEVDTLQKYKGHFNPRWVLSQLHLFRGFYSVHV